MRRFLLTLGACSVIGLALMAAEGEAYKLLCVSQRSGNLDIFLMNADGSAAKNLTNNPGLDSFPAWSPDGKLIAFTSTRDGNQEIYVMAADGSNVKQLTKGTGSSRSPAWSPDGKQIAFCRLYGNNHEIFLMNADGSCQFNLTNDPAYDADPAWSPDGRTIAYASNRGGGGFRIYTIDAIRGNVEQLTTANNTQGSAYPAWSPDSKQIAYSDVDGANLELFLLDVRTKTRKQLTKLTGFNTYVAWSPDGKKLAFQHRAEGDAGSLYVMDADGGNLKQVLPKGDNPTQDGGRPAWQPK